MVAMLSPSVKHGIGRLTASASSSSVDASRRRTTRLTQVSHKAPTRWIPLLQKSSVNHAGAAMVALSHYGGGMLPGDKTQLTVQVQSHAKLGITTQGSNRIYKQLQQSQKLPQPDQDDGCCRVDWQIQVQANGFCVIAPDPCAVFATSKFQQNQTIQIHPTSSLVLIDWFSSGRYRNGERWQMSQLSSHTKLEWLKNDAESSPNIHNNNMDIPLLVDSIDLRSKNDNHNLAENDWFGLSDHINTFATLILYGPQANPVVQECCAIQELVMAQSTRIRERQQSSSAMLGTSTEGEESSGNLHTTMLRSLYGPVCIGVNKVPVILPPLFKSDESHRKEQRTDCEEVVHVIRFIATTNEDLYRILHACLRPLSKPFGYNFYKERITAITSEISRQPSSSSSMETPTLPNHRRVQSAEMERTTGTNKTTNLYSPWSLDHPTKTDSAAFWSAHMLTDSILPTGSFAHSSGVEAAAQLGWFQKLNISNNKINNGQQQHRTKHLEPDVVRYIQTAVRSTMQTAVPFVLAGHALGAKVSPAVNLLLDFDTLNQQAQAVLCTNTLACEASLDQGKSLARVAKQWFTQSSSLNESQQKNLEQIQQILASCETIHVGPMIGLIGRWLGLGDIQTCRLLGYCTARDMISAAVRLNLIGPLASIPHLQTLQLASEQGLLTSLERMQLKTNSTIASVLNPIEAASSCSPVMDAIHPCHDLLQVRLFRT